MTVETLRAYRASRIEVERIYLQIDRLNGIYYPQAKKITGMPAAGDPEADKMAEFVNQKMQLEALLQSRINELLSMQYEVEAAINSLENITERTVMRCRYIEGLSWYDCEDITGYERRQLQRILKRAKSKICR